VLNPEITTVPYDSYQNAKLDLQNGRIDAVFGDTAVVGLVRPIFLHFFQRSVKFLLQLGIALTNRNAEAGTESLISILKSPPFLMTATRMPNWICKTAALTPSSATRYCPDEPQCRGRYRSSLYPSLYHPPAPASDCSSARTVLPIRNSSLISILKSPPFLMTATRMPNWICKTFFQRSVKFLLQLGIALTNRNAEAGTEVVFIRHFMFQK
jgi:hypothetical protein